jgi:BASS family bile acid:Na+ symporter
VATIQLLLQGGLILIMFEVGLTLAAADFLRLAQAPRAVLTGLAAQIVLLPVLAILLLLLWPMSPEMTIGVLLIAAAPGGVTSNLLTLFAQGDVALALTLTAISTLASVVTLPLIVSAAASLLGAGALSLKMPIAMMTSGILTSTIIPLVAGMAVRAYLPRWTARWEPVLRRVSALVFAAIVVVTFAGNVEAFRLHALTVGPLLFVLNALAMTGAAGVAVAARLDRRCVIAISFETGLQNAALAIFLAISILGHPVLAVPAIIYAVAMNIGAIAALAALRSRRKDATAAVKESP